MASYSQIVRQVMKDHGRFDIFASNTRKGNRRVKCFGYRGDTEANEALAEEIRKVLRETDCPFFDVRIRPCYPDDSIIVEVPPN